MYNIYAFELILGWIKKNYQQEDTPYYELTKPRGHFQHWTKKKIDELLKSKNCFSNSNLCHGSRMLSSDRNGHLDIHSININSDPHRTPDWKIANFILIPEAGAAPGQSNPFEFRCG
jgi:hypothetical protein